MKTKAKLCLAIAALATFASSPLVSAQIDGSPARIDYQGRVLKANGDPVADGAVENVEMYFRIWNDSSASAIGNLVWAEKQVVTVADGNFSVSLGEGAVIETSAGDNVVSAGNDDPRPDLTAAFDGSERYLGVSVAPSSMTKPDSEILPRLAFLAAPFAIAAERAKLADSVTGVVNATAGSSFDGIINAGAGSTITGGTFSGGTFSGNGSDLTSLDAGNLSSGTIDDSRLSSSVALLNRSPQNFTGGINSFSGNVGIGRTNPQQPLDVDGTIRVNQKIRAADNGGLELATDEGQTRLKVVDNGNVGIGTTSPGSKLHVDGTIRVNQQIRAADIGGLELATDEGTPRVKIVDNGNVGIGTTSPGAKLHVEGTIEVDQKIQANDSGGLELATDEGTTRVKIADSGKVGIGTTSPTKARLEIDGSSLQPYPAYRHYELAGDTLEITGSPSGRDTSIYASDRVAGQSFIAFSDRRIKDIVGRSDWTQDVATMMRIEVTDYTHKDVVSKGKASHKKVIAQQVEEVFPQAVSQSTDVVPDIYQPAKVREGWIELATDLEAGERVCLISDTERKVYDVLEVADGKFRTDLDPADGKVFVFGREVDDFRSVDYEAIAMLNVSATQEIYRQLLVERDLLQEERSARSELETRLAALEAREKEREAKFARLEKLLDAEEPRVAPVSTTLSAIK